MAMHPTVRPVHFALGMDDVPLLQPLAERRGADRLEFPACRVCAMTAHVVVLRTPYVLYLRCPDCGDVQPIAKPCRHMPPYDAGFV